MVVEWGERWWSAVVVADLGGDVWKVHYEGWGESWDEAVGPERIRADAGPRPAVRPAGPRGTPKFFMLILGVILVAGVVVGISLVGRGTAEPPPGIVPDSTTSIALGQSVQVEWNGSWYEGTIIALRDDGRLRIHYEGWADSYDEEVTRDRLRVTGSIVAVEPTFSVATAETPLNVGQPVQVDWNGSWYAATVLEVMADGQVRIHYEGWSDNYDEVVPRSRIRAPAGR